MLIRQVMAKLVITVSPMFFLRTMPPENKAKPGMVINNTMAIEVSIQAVSHEFGVQFSVTLTPAQAGGAAGAAAAAVSVAVCANDECSTGGAEKGAQKTNTGNAP